MRRSHPLYGVWQSMLARCHSPLHNSFHVYGACGITVCNRWRYGGGGRDGFECFVDDMGERPDGTSLERTDNLGPYSPENCRWATTKEQMANRGGKPLSPGRNACREAFLLNTEIDPNSDEFLSLAWEIERQSRARALDVKRQCSVRGHP